MAYNTYGKQSNDDNDWGYALLQQPHAQESQQQWSQTWNQSIQVILQGSNLDWLQGHTGSNLLEGHLDAFAPCRQLIPLIYAPLES